MKKMMCVLILVAFIGSMVVMTGCFGGSSGGILAAAVFVLAISASGGSAAAFAADLRAAGASITNHEITMIVQPLDSTGAVTGTAETITESSITYDETTKQFKTNKSVNIADGYNQYRIEVKAGGVTLVKAIKFLKDSEKTGDVPVAVTASTTAHVMVYDKWTATNQSTFGQFLYNLDDADKNAIETLAGKIDTELNANTTNPDYVAEQAEADGIAPSVTNNPLQYAVSGYITAADGQSGQDAALVNVYSGTEASGEIYTHTSTESGEFTVSLPNGTYTLAPSKELHTYTPVSKTITVSNDDVSDVNFQAARTQ